jgi:RecB family exonuclease
MPIARHFLNWNRPVLPAVVDYLLKRYASEDSLDLSGVVLVLTGHRAARRMLELLVETASDRWPDFRPPRLITFSQLPEQLYPQKKQLADDLTQLMVWNKALASITHQEIQAALPVLPDQDSVPARLAICQSLKQQHDELAAVGLEFDEVAAALSQTGNRLEADRWQALRRIQAEYLVQMDALNLWDRQAARLVAAQNKECQADFDIVLVGTVDINKIVRQMLALVADRVTTLIHAPESEAESFDEFGCLIADHWEHRQVDVSLDATRIADGPADQADAVIGCLADSSPALRADEVVIGIADDDLVPVVQQSLADSGISNRWPVGSQLSASRPCRLIQSIAEHLASARNGMPPDFFTLSDLVRHPDVSHWIDLRFESDLFNSQLDENWLTVLDRYLADHLQTTPGVLLGPKHSRAVVGFVCESIHELLSMLLPPDSRKVATAAHSASPKTRQHKGRQRQLAFDEDADDQPASLASQLNRRRPLNEWAQGTLRLLDLVYRDYVTGRHTERDESLLAFSAAISDCIDALQQVPSSVMLSCTASQALQILLRQLADKTVPPADNSSAIDLLGWLELPMDDSPHLILTGFNEGSVPESVSSDVFLPNSLRSQLGLMDNRQRYARDAYAITSMLHSRDSITFISGRRDDQGNPLIPSRLWFAVPAEQIPARVEYFYGDSVAEQSAGATAISLQQPSDKSGFIVPEPPVTPNPPEEIAVTAFREYLACPYRYFLKRELKLRAIEDHVRELTAPAFGSLIHDTLNAFGDSDYAHATTPEAIETFLLQTLHQLANRRFGRTRSATVSVQLQMAEDRLKSFSVWQAESNKEGWQIQYTEKDLLYPDFQDSLGRTVALRGRVDRIDQHRRTGEWRVLDYKTSETAAKPEKVHQKKDKWIDLQLPLYRLLVRTIGVDTSVQLGYVHLPGDLSSVGASLARWTEEQLAEADQTARNIAAAILDLKIDQVASGREQPANEFSRVCQDTVIDRNIPWLETWSGRKTK